MITIIFAPPRTGKTCFMTHILNEAAFNRERTRAMQCEILQKNANGFNLSIPQHCVSANYDLKMKKFRYSPRVNRRINPYRLGFANKYVDVHFNFPLSHPLTFGIRQPTFGIFILHFTLSTLHFRNHTQS